MAGGAAATLREEERRKTQPLRRRACNRRGSSLAAYAVDLSWIDFKKLRRIVASARRLLPPPFDYYAVLLRLWNSFRSLTMARDLQFESDESLRPLLPLDKDSTGIETCLTNRDQ